MERDKELRLGYIEPDEEVGHISRETLESPLYSKEIKPVKPKGNQP